MSSTRFHKAAKDGLIEVLKEATASDVNEKDAMGMTPVLYAAFEGKLDALRLLVGRGGDPDKRDQFGNTALHCAAAKGHMNCVDFLVKFGTNFYALDIDGHNAKDLAAINNRDDILRYLDVAITNFELTDKRKAKTMKENAEKKYDKLSKKYAKKMQKIEESNGESIQQKSTKLSSLTQFWKGTVKGQSSQQSNSPQMASQIFANQQQSTNFSGFVGGGNSISSHNGSSTLKGLKGTMSIVNKRSTAVKLSKQQQQQLSNPFNNNADFKIGEIEPESGKRSVRSIQGLRRDSEVLYVGTFQNNPDAGKRGVIGDLFDDVDHNDDDDDENDESIEVKFANGKKFSTMSRSLSQPNFFNESYGNNEDNLNEEVIMQRPSGIFNRPSLGNLAIGRSVTATLSQIAPEIQSVDSVTASRILPKKLQPQNTTNGHEPRKFKPRLHLMDDDDDDSDTDVGSTSDPDEKDARHSYTGIQRFLIAHELDEYFPIFDKQKIDLNTLMLLTESDIKSLDLPLGPRRRLIYAIQQRNAALQNPGPISDTVL